MSRPSSFAPFSSPAKASRSSKNHDPAENIWSSLLDSVSSGRRLPEKQLIILGAYCGNPETQKEFLSTLAADDARRPNERHRRRPPIANDFALGYTYQDVLDADHEDVLARLSIYTLPSPSLEFAPLLVPLLTKRTVPETLLVILLDWAEPWDWVRQIRDRIRVLREVLTVLDEEAKGIMGEIMEEWQQRRRGPGVGYEGSGGGLAEGNVVIPLGPGEWDEALGLPLCVVCHNCDKIDILEKERGWREDEFDYVFQFLRTILLKHGASLIYTSSSMPNSLPTLIHSTLGIHSLLKRQPLKHNVIDRDRVLVPPNWDSWGKIRVLREGFDVEGISKGWSIDIEPVKSQEVAQDSKSKANGGKEEHLNAEGPRKGGPLADYEGTIQNPRHTNSLETFTTTKDRLEVDTPNMQDFLASQLEIIERLKAEELEADGKDANANGSASQLGRADIVRGTIDTSSRVNEHIGPVQFNMGGIEVDAEDMLKRLSNREREETPDRDGRRPTTPDGKSENEALANFFAGLMKKGGSSSPRQASTG